MHVSEVAGQHSSEGPVYWTPLVLVVRADQYGTTA